LCKCTVHFRVWNPELYNVTLCKCAVHFRVWNPELFTLIWRQIAKVTRLPTCTPSQLLFTAHRRQKCCAELIFKFSPHVVHFLNPTVRHCNGG
jgi:hypothetical protein